jgi:signal transduction histidine kinase
MIEPKKQRRLLTRPNIGFGLALIVLGGIALLSYRNSQSVAEVAETRQRALTRLDQLQEFLAAALDIETGQRGYIVTGDVKFLAPYHAGMAQLKPQLLRLHTALTQDPRQQAALAALDEAVAQLVRYHREVIAFEAHHDHDSARNMVATGRGKEIMDGIRELIADLRSEERAQLQQSEWQFQNGFHWSMIIIVVGSVIGLAAVSLAAIAINRSLRERTRLNEELRHALSENIQMVDQLRAAGAELTRSNQDLEQFAYVASHDLQEPLRKVSSFAQLLAVQYRGKLDADADEFIGYMVDGALRMQTLIQNLLTFSRLGRKSKPFAPVNGNAVLKQALANLQTAVEESGAVVTSSPLPTVLADEGQLVQLFQNLIANAVKFHGPAKPLIHIQAEVNGTVCTFSVRDNGIGIDPQFAERIFVIFQRLHTREEYAGTGIGLAICRKIVERHAGRIWMESEPPVNGIRSGAVFLFTLPQKAA